MQARNYSESGLLENVLHQKRLEAHYTFRLNLRMSLLISNLGAVFWNVFVFYNVCEP
jgi:hypothetical protein